jgi:hypothetical protein
MIRRLQADRTVSAILALFLLLAQLALLAHVAEDALSAASATPHAACLLCHLADSFSHGLVCTGVPPARPRPALEIRQPPSTQLLSTTPHLFCARDPPVALFSLNV